MENISFATVREQIIK